MWQQRRNKSEAGRSCKKNGIALVNVELYRENRGSFSLLDGEITGAGIVFHTMFEGDTFQLGIDRENLRTFLLIDGAISVNNGKDSAEMEKRTVYVADPEKKVFLFAKESSHLLEIRWRLGEERRDKLKTSGKILPMIQAYNACPQYRESFKSKKSISRSIIDHHVLPDFCMGSNESYGPDRVEKHMHPLLDQFFFSFEDNEIELMIDDKIQPYGSNTLLHIPLGSDHGVIIPEGKKMHYVWIDFMVADGAVEYLDEVHKKTGVIEHFDENGEIRK